MAAHASPSRSSPLPSSSFHHLRKLDKKAHFRSSFNSVGPFLSPPWNKKNAQFIITFNSSASPPPPTLDEDLDPSSSSSSSAAAATALAILEFSYENSSSSSSSSYEQINNQIGNRDDFILELLRSPNSADLGFEMYEKAKESSGFRLQRPTFKALLKYLVKSKRWDSIASTINDLKKYRVFPVEGLTFAKVISSCIKARKFKLVDLLLQAFKDSGGVEGQVSSSAPFDAAFRGYNKLHMYSSSVAVYEQMVSAGVALDVPGGSCYCSVMEAYMKLGKSDKVEELFNKVQLQLQLGSENKYSARIYQVLIEALGKSGEAFRALDYFNQMQQAHGIPPNASIYASLIGSFASIGEVEAAESLAEQARRKQMLKDPALFLKLVSMYINAEGKTSIDNTLDVVDTMRAANIKVSDCIFCAIVNGFVRQRGLESARQVYEDLVSKGIEPGQVTYASILNVYCRLGLYPEAETVFSNMEQRGFDRCVVAYSSMIVMYGKTGKMRQAMKLVAKMKSKGCEPNVWIYNALIELQGKAKNLRQVEKLWKEMKRRRVGPDRVSYTSLISAYSKAREYDKCVHSYREFRLNGGVVDRTMAGIMVGVLSKLGRIEELVKLLQEMKTQGTGMDARLYKSALYALKDAGLEGHLSWLKENFFQKSFGVTPPPLRT